MELTTVWFVAIAFFWVGYLVLEGFDFGVGMLAGLLARDGRERRVLYTTIGPLWDGNEVWVVVAAGATFAAFPEWYATMFSGFYLPLFVILVALIVRIVGLEYRSKRTDAAWRRNCDIAIIAGSTVPAVVWGIALANLVGGTPIDADGEFVGSIVDLLGPYAVLGGVVLPLLFLVHGAVFVALKTVGDLRVRARRFALRLGPVAVAAVAAFGAWTAAKDGGDTAAALAVTAVGAVVAALVALAAGREGWAFTGTAIGVAALAATLFVALFPDVMVSSLDPAWNLTTTTAASTDYTLEILTWAGAAVTPVVMGYQAWSAWVFRRRIGVQHLPADPVVGG